MWPFYISVIGIGSATNNMSAYVGEASIPSIRRIKIKMREKGESHGFSIWYGLLLSYNGQS